MGELVTVEVEGAVATVRLDNPPANAMALPLLLALGDRALELAGEEAIRAVVLASSGERAFAAGADLAEFAALLGSPSEIEEHTSASRRALDALAAMPQPVVAAVQAAAVGGGFELALACDLIVADERARFGLPEVNLGLMPGAGGTQRLSRRVCVPHAAGMILTGSLIPAAEAQRLGLVWEVAEPGGADAAAAALAAGLAARPRLAVQAIKRALREGADQPLAAALDAERELFSALLASADAGIGVRAFLEREKPEFVHR